MRLPDRIGLTLAATAAAFVVACASPASPPVALLPPRVFAPVTHGVAAGDVTATRAVIWSRTDRHSAMHVRIESEHGVRHAARWVTAGEDFTGKVVLTELTPATSYRYTVWFSYDDSADPPPRGFASAGIFHTAPPPSDVRAVTFGWSGDLGGIDVCRDATVGYPIFRTLDGSGLDFFLGLGDLIYGDMACTPRGYYGGNPQIPTPVGMSTTIRDYWAHWKYNREDDGFQRLLASTAFYDVWDDHEVTNDFSPSNDWRRAPPYVVGARLTPLGRRAMLDYNPTFEDPSAPTRLYRSVRWGQRLELVFLDTRSYRDPNEAVDTPERPKTLLGAEQRTWLEETVARSDATWQVVVSSVPISIPTGRGGDSGHDGWANFGLASGFEQELRAIFEAFRSANKKNILFITTDVHFATGFAYHPFPESPDFVVYESTAGPLNAMLLPNHDFDDTFHPERLFFYGPSSTPKSFTEATQFMNWGKISIAADGDLSLSIINALGVEVVQRRIIAR